MPNGGGGGGQEPPEARGAAWLVASFATVTALIGAFGAAPGTVVDRTLNNEPFGMAAAFFLAIAAVVLAVFAYLSETYRRWLLRLSLLAFTVGVLLLVYLFTSSRIAEESPSVRAALKGGTGLTLDVTAKAAGLTSNEQIFVYVYGLRVKEVDAVTGAPIEFERELMYTSQTGPDKGGSVDLSFEVPVPIARYYSVGVVPSLERDRSLCSEDELKFRAGETPSPSPTTETPAETPSPSPTMESPSPSPDREAACLVLRIPIASRRPQLFGTLKANENGGYDLSIRVKGANVGSGQALLVRVRGLGTKLDHPVGMYRAGTGADSAGVIDGTIDLQVVHPRIEVICVEAAPLGLVDRPAKSDPDPGRLACPQRISSLSAIMRLPVPPQRRRNDRP